jgi:hypothetical protein
LTGDEIIHRGPLYGVAIREALPYVDRLDELAPTHGDNAFHRLMVATAIADTTLMRVATRQMREREYSPAPFSRPPPCQYGVRRDPSPN